MNHNIENNINEYIYEFPLNTAENNIYYTIENIIEDIFINTNILNINNINNDFIQLNIDIDIFGDNLDEEKYNFKNCKEINEKIGKSNKIKKGCNKINEDCLICLEKYKEKELYRELPKCNHYFHKKCIDKWLKSNAVCPICRNNIINI